MIRVVLAVALASALFGIAAPSAEAVDRERSTELATDELEGVTEAAERLAATNDPVAPGHDPAATTITIDPPTATFAESGRIRLAEDELRWEPPTGPDRTVDAAVPIRVATPTVVTDRTRLRLSFVPAEGTPVVRLRVDPGRV